MADEKQKKAAPKKPAKKAARASDKVAEQKVEGSQGKGARPGGSGREAEQPPVDETKPRRRRRSKSDSPAAGGGAPKTTAKEKKPAPVLVRASSRYVRVAPRKARLVADQVRGLNIDRARALLQFSPRGAARDIGKLIESAASNAENNHDLVADEMRVAEITVDEGPTLRRFRPRALGRATPINKRTSHIAVALSPEEDI
jgi:ribosomal protein L22